MPEIIFYDLSIAQGKLLITKHLLSPPCEWLASLWSPGRLPSSFAQKPYTRHFHIVSEPLTYWGLWLSRLCEVPICMNVIKFGYFLIDLSHVDLIIRPATRTLKGQENFFLSQMIKIQWPKQRTECVSSASLGLPFCLLGPYQTGEALIWSLPLMAG